MDSLSAKDLSTLIQEITWRFGARGPKGECCGDLSQPEYRTLCLVSDQFQCSMQAVAQDLGFTKSGATRVIDRLERKGLVKRMHSPEDGRVCFVRLTPPGQELISSAREEYENQVATILSKIDPPMQQVIRAALASFVNAMKNEH